MSNVLFVCPVALLNGDRSSDGLTLYAVSSDGTMAVFSFDREELVDFAPREAQEQYLKKFGFTPPPLPEGFSHQPKQPDARMTPPPSPGRTQAKPHTQDTGFGSVFGGGEHVNKLVAKRKTKKRPTFVGTLASSISSASTAINNIPSASTSTDMAGPSKLTGRSFHEIAGIIPSSRPPASAPPPPTKEPTYSSASFSAPRVAFEDNSLELRYPSEDYDMNTDVPISSLDTNGRGKRKSGVMDPIDDRPSKARTLGGDRPRDTVPVKELASGATSVVVYDAAVNTAGPSFAARLPVAQLLTYIKADVEGSEDFIEARNSESGRKLCCFKLPPTIANDTLEPHEVIYISGKSTQWLDYVSSPVLILVGTSTFCAVAMSDGSVNVYSPNGRR